MASGDRRSVAERVYSGNADGLSVDEVCVELMPEDKVSAVEDLRRRFGPVAMVGDGINDAPSLHAADVGLQRCRHRQSRGRYYPAREESGRRPHWSAGNVC